MLIREKDKQCLLDIFSSSPIPIEVWAFGSRVNGTAHDGSDLDIVIRAEGLKPLPIEVYAEITSKIKNSNIPILVELREWTMLPEAFYKNIEAKYEVLFDGIHKDRKFILNDDPTKYLTKE
jgi:predicted nucleotidyltransferase